MMSSRDVCRRVSGSMALLVATMWSSCQRPPHDLIVLDRTSSGYERVDIVVGRAEVALRRKEPQVWMGELPPGESLQLRVFATKGGSRVPVGECTMSTMRSSDVIMIELSEGGVACSLGRS